MIRHRVTELERRLAVLESEHDHLPPGLPLVDRRPPQLDRYDEDDDEG